MENQSHLILGSGEYWYRKVKLYNNSQFKVDGSSVMLNISDSLKVEKDASLNEDAHPLSVFVYGSVDDTVQLLDQAIVKGRVHSNGELEIKDTARLYLNQDTYWFYRLDLEDQAQIILMDKDAELTTFHIDKSLKMVDGGTTPKINTLKAEPLLIFVYDSGEDRVKMDDQAEISAHIYTKSDVKMEHGATINGAVNVRHLKMKDYSQINYKPLEGVASQSGHYRLYFALNDESTSSSLTAFACKDDDCEEKHETANLSVEGNSTLPSFSRTYEFNDIESTGTRYQNDVTIANQCVAFTLLKEGTTPQVDSSPLRCFVAGDEVSECNVCGNYTAASSYGYVFGMATIPKTQTQKDKKFTVVKGAVEGLTTTGDKPVELSNASPFTLPLEVTFNKADKVDLVLADVDGLEYPVSVTFVPESLAWVAQSGKNGCGETGFDYANDNSTCAVLAAAGNNVSLALVALGKGKKIIPDYQIALESGAVKITELDDGHKAYKVNDKDDVVNYKLDFVSNSNAGSESEYATNRVALIKAEASTYCTSTGEIGTCAPEGEGLTTGGDSLIIGRTVPASLQILTKKAGEITGGKVYAKQPKTIEFDTLPQFVVQGLDSNNDPLTSYTGQFAAGLYDESKIELENAPPHSGIQLANPIFDTEQPGNHVFELDASNLVFAKDKPFKEVSLALPLQLTIEDHDTYTKGINSSNGNSSTLLADHGDTLRFGFLTLDGLELPVGQDGEMKTHLNYYLNYESKEINTVNEDSDFPYELTASNKPVLDPSLSPSPQLRVTAKELEVPAYEQPWKGTVKIKVPHWLKPDTSSDWIVPATLTITSDARKRGNDRVFNRREVVR